MGFHGDLADSKVTCDLLVHLAGRDQQHDLLLARSQRSEAAKHSRDITVNRPPPSIAFDCGHYGVEHVLIADWFGKKVDRTALHGANGHGDIAIPSDHYHRQPNTQMDQLGMKIEPIHVRQADVDNDASWFIVETRG